MDNPEHAAKPNRQVILARASMLADAGDLQGALALLRAQRATWKRVPPAYDAKIGRLCAQTGDFKAATEYLCLASDGYGVDMPRALRRSLIATLLESGRVEAAGREIKRLMESGARVSQPAWLRAVEAFDNKPETEPDAGRATPHRILARAEFLVAAQNHEAAASLMATHRPQWETVPAAYDDLLGKLEYETSDRQAAAARLTQARDDCAGVVPGRLRLQLGTALYELGQLDDAGRELNLAIDSGIEIPRLALQVTADTYRRRNKLGPPVDTTFGRALTFVDLKKRLVYVAVPKNASTLLKTMFAMNTHYRDAYLASKKPAHGFFETLGEPPVPRDTILSQDYFRFVILRDPLRRLLSAYLDKFVRRRKARQPFLRRQQMAHTIRAAQAVAGIEYDPARSISFEQFVRFLARADDSECNMHWMPQYRVVGTDLSLYHHVGKVERLDETLDLLAERFEFVTKTDPEGRSPVVRSHIARFNEATDLAEPYRALPEQLDAFEDNMPVPARFYSPELTQLVEERYAADIALYRQV